MSQKIINKTDDSDHLLNNNNDDDDEAFRLSENSLPNQSGWRVNYTHHSHENSFVVTAIKDYSRPPRGKFYFKKGQSILVSASWNYPFTADENLHP